MVSFGPIQSRRLGKSLGINNIISPKVCSYGCIYCQVGTTIKKSIKRETFFKPETIFKKVDQHIQQLSKNNYPDYLTFVSNGEPTLDTNLGTAIRLLKKLAFPIAVITNASLITLESVKNDLYMADWISVKMDAGDNDIWKTINNPAPGLNFENIIENINLFAGEFKGILRTETMLVDGVNDTNENITNLSKLIQRINPGKAYLSIPTRPPSNASVKPPKTEILNQAWQIYNNMNINTEFLTGFEGTDNGYTGNIYDDILNITAVHPLREDSLLKLLKNDNADFQVVKSLTSQRLIRATTYNGNKYYLREYHINI